MEETRRIQLTKQGLRDEQKKLVQLQKYLPTLQLKKALLQVEVAEVRMEWREKKQRLDTLLERLESVAVLLSEPGTISAFDFVQIEKINQRIENVAGVEIPVFLGIEFKERTYSLLETPIFFDQLVDLLRRFVALKEEIHLIQIKKEALEKELTEVSIRVNLFEKILIPRATEAIKKIRIFLGDQQLNAVAQAKVAKLKIEKKKMYDYHA